jgi:KH domain
MSSSSSFADSDPNRLVADPVAAQVAGLREMFVELRDRLDASGAPSGKKLRAQVKKTRLPDQRQAAPPPTPSAKADSKTKGKKARPPSCPATTIATTTLSLPLAQALSMQGKSDRFQLTVVLPDAVVGHVVGRQGHGLKQVADISGARVSAFILKDGPADQRHVTIQGSDVQIGDALVVVGKRLARKHVRSPKASKATKPKAPAVKVEATATPTLSYPPASTAREPSPQPSPAYRAPRAPTPETPCPGPSRPSQPTRPSPTETPMGTPMSVDPQTYPGTPMEIGRARGGGAPHGRISPSVLEEQARREERREEYRAAVGAGRGISRGFARRGRR